MGEEKKFVIQQHFLNQQNCHFDLMFEEEGVLKTFQVNDIYELINNGKTQATKIQDHRLVYLDYEGEISNNRGYVKIFDRGSYSLVAKDINVIRYRVNGKHLNGLVCLTLEDESSTRWCVEYKPVAI